MKIIIGADIVPTRSNTEFFKNGQTDRILDEKIVQMLNMLHMVIGVPILCNTSLVTT